MDNMWVGMMGRKGNAYRILAEILRDVLAFLKTLKNDLWLFSGDVYSMFAFEPMQKLKFWNVNTVKFFFELCLVCKALQQR